MNMNSIVDNRKITGKVKDVYKFITKHEKTITCIFDTVYNDISSIFSDVDKDEDKISITVNDDSVNSVYNMVRDVVAKHTKDKLGEDNEYIIPYVFKVTVVNNTISAILKM